ncbi:MAG TPA: putative toxin-antitoxin system toxin component, PIN family [Rhizomicrobium sp.]|nr:putative toxin-antitoxin system toxin component, PIN family [Rhizomicrobium sp.]
MRLVLDTNIVVAAMRSPSGASAALLQAARRKKITMVANVALALEYEATCLLAEHRLAAGLGLEDTAIFIDAVIALCEPVENSFMWRPQLRDPADEMVLEAAVNGQARAIVTFNRRDFENVAQMFGVGVWLPSQALRRMEK